MKTHVRNYLLTILVALPFLFSSCEQGLIGISGEGEVVQATLDVYDFDGFNNNIAADIYVSQGEDYEVIVEAQENIIDNINIDDIDQGIWKIKYYRPVRWSKPVKIYVTLPYLSHARINGSGDVIGETVFTDIEKLDLTIAGSGKMDLEAYSEEVSIRILGSGDVKLTGECDILDCAISGSGSIHAFSMMAYEADVDVSGSGDSNLNVEESLNVHISGSGSVIYRGNPYVDSRILGSGSVKRDR